MSILSIGELLDLGNSASTAGLVPYSALEYNASGDISGISGSAIAGGVDTTIVSSIASSYVVSGVSGKADQSALEDCCSSMSAVVSAKLDASASSQFQPSGSYADASSLSSKLDASASGMFAPSGNYAPSGDYAYNSSLSGKLDASASSQFAPSGNYVFESSYSSFTGDVTDNITSISSIVSGITGDWSSKADTSALDNKMDKSASSQFAPSGDYAFNSALSSYVNYSAISGEGGKVTSINGSGISAQAVPTLPLYVASPLTAGIDDMSSQVTIGLSAGAFQPSGSYVSSDTFTAYTASTTPVQVVATSAEATGSNIVYIVTAEP